MNSPFCSHVKRASNFIAIGPRFEEVFDRNINVCRLGCYVIWKELLHTSAYWINVRDSNYLKEEDRQYLRCLYRFRRRHG